MTEDIDRRLKEHNSGKTQSTSYYKPFDLLYTEQVDNRLQARIREKYWKSGVGKEQLRRMII